MVSKKDVEILSHLRQDARKKVTDLSRKVHLPPTTVYGKMKSHEKKGFVKRHVALLDFSKLGYSTTALVAFKVENNKREEFQKFISEHTNINSLYRINFGHDFLAEFIFEDMSKLQEFIDCVEMMFHLQDTKVFSVIDELKKEVFLRNPTSLAAFD